MAAVFLFCCNFRKSENLKRCIFVSGLLVWSRISLKMSVVEFQALLPILYYLFIYLLINEATHYHTL
jgi:hypothetical protein